MRLYLSLLLFVVSLGLACGGGSYPPVTSAVVPGPVGEQDQTHPVPPPAGFREVAALAGREACDDGVGALNRCGVLGPDGTWWYPPSLYLNVEDAGEGVMMVHEGPDTTYLKESTGEHLYGRTFAGECGKFADRRAWAQDSATSVEDDSTVSYGRLMGYVLLDPTGRIVKDFGKELFTADDFSEGLAAACATAPDPDDTDENDMTDKCGLDGYLDLEGNWAIPPQFKATWAFKDGRAKVLGVDGRRYVIDKTGAEVAP